MRGEKKDFVNCDDVKHVSMPEFAKMSLKLYVLCSYYIYMNFCVCECVRVEERYE